ncbi:MAG: glycosyltransferase [Acidobacteriota bacterium]|nr:glycosyltransferase [Acidobacteriota bacterium]
MSETVSAIVPTIGRPDALSALFEALSIQTRPPDEVIVADGSAGDAVAGVCEDARWPRAGLRVRRVLVRPPHAVRQRQAAIALATGSFLLLLDDDVVPEPGCVAAMLAAIGAPGVVAITADFSNQPWSGPTRLWRAYLTFVEGMADNAWQGKVVGPLLRFGYRPSPAHSMPMEWLGAGNSLVRRSAFDQAGGFSDFFLHRSTMNEDVDLGLKLGRVGRILLCPDARMAHHHAPSGRVSSAVAAEDDLYNRYLILRRTVGRSRWHAFGLVCLFLGVETLGNLGGSLWRFQGNGFIPRLAGRLRAVGRILVPSRREAGV